MIANRNTARSMRSRIVKLVMLPPHDLPIIRTRKLISLLIGESIKLLDLRVSRVDHFGRHRNGKQATGSLDD